jgi:hypothetical protein
MKHELNQLRTKVTQAPNLKMRAREILILAKTYYTERQWLIRYYELRSLMGRWRFLHRWFAIVVLVMAVFHIIVSVQMGNLWFLKGAS